MHSSYQALVSQLKGLTMEHTALRTLYSQWIEMATSKVIPSYANSF